MQQLEQRMQILNETPRRGGPNTPHSLGMLCPPLLPVRDAAAAEPWARASQQACLEGTALFHRGTDNLLLASCEEKYPGRMAMFAYPGPKASRLCRNGKRLAGLRVPSPAPGL